MSEYQYYEFLAVDRPLTAEERREIGSWSSRTEPTTTHAVFTYSYSDFPRNARKVLAQYFDAMLYLANWGSRRLMFRLPRTLVRYKDLAPYRLNDEVCVVQAGEHVIVDIAFHDEEGGDWVEGEGWLASLIPLREHMLQGDRRMLYLAWLRSALGEWIEEEDLDLLEPPVPPNLGTLSAPLQAFINFFEIPSEQVEVAAAASAQVTNVEPVWDSEALIAQLPEDERNGFLLRVLKGEPHLHVHLRRRLQEAAGVQAPLGAGDETQPRRTIAALRQAVAARQEAKAAKRRKAAERKRLQRLAELARAEPHLWRDVEQLIERKTSKAYGEAVKLLRELRQVAEHQGTTDHFFARIRRLQQAYSRRSAFCTRLKQAGLWQEG